MSKQLCIISYDISDDKLLRKTAQYLETKGTRLQKSVFAVETTKEQFQNIKVQLQNLLGDEHSVLYIPLCSSCKNKAEFLGKIENHWEFY